MMEEECDEDSPNPNQQGSVETILKHSRGLFPDGVEATNEQITDGTGWKRSAYFDKRYQKVRKWRRLWFTVIIDILIRCLFQ